MHVNRGSIVLAYAESDDHGYGSVIGFSTVASAEALQAQAQAALEEVAYDLIDMQT